MRLMLQKIFEEKKSGGYKEMTKAPNRDAWLKAWEKEADYLTRAYQCLADPVVFEKLKSNIKEIKEVFGEIADLMESEGVWKKEGSP